MRTTHPETPHGDVEDIWLRFNDLEPLRRTGDAATVTDEHESICYPAWHALPEARLIIFDLMRRLGALRLGRVLITRLAPGKVITPHVDGGEHAAYYERAHLVIQGLPGSLFRCGEESITMHTGEVYWFNNALEHEVLNNSAADRIHMIVDYRIAR